MTLRPEKGRRWETLVWGLTAGYSRKPEELRIQPRFIDNQQILKEESDLESNIYECVLLKLNFSLKSPPFPVKENQMKTNLFVKQVWF